MLLFNCRTGLGAMAHPKPECALSKHAFWYSALTGPCPRPRYFYVRTFRSTCRTSIPIAKVSLVSPCLFEGSLDELLHRFGLDAIVDQLIDWLHKAAAGTLLDLEQGWEPTRRDSCPSTVVFSAEKVAAAAPTDGTILVVPAGYVTIDGGLYAIVNAELTAQIDPVFYQDVHNDKLGKWGNGHTAAFIARAPMTDGHPHVVGRYQPETVVDLATLLDRAAELGIDRDALAQSLDGYYGRSILDIQQDSRGWVHGLYAIVILTVQRPASLVGSPGRSIEVLPYVVRYELNAQSLLERTPRFTQPFTPMRCLPSCWQGRLAFHQQPHRSRWSCSAAEAWDRKSRCNWGERVSAR
jgi:hypothetical protein